MANKTTKELLIEKTADDLGQPLSIVEEVVGWVMKDTFKALKKYDEVEVSGFGKFLISQAKLRKRIITHERILSHLLSHPQTEERDVKIEGVKATLNYYYSKIKTNENNKENLQTDVGGMAQPNNSPGSFEGTNSHSVQPEAGSVSELS